MDKKIAAYVRVSTVHQVDKESIPSQVHMIQNYCNAIYGTTEGDIDFYIDAGFSGKNTNRPKYMEMIKAIKERKYQTIVVYKIDRVSRNLLDFATFIDILKSVQTDFISLSEKFDTSTAMGQGMLNMTMVFAEIERNLTKERVMSVSKDIVSRGGHLGNPTPYGYTYSKETKDYTINEDEAQKVKEMYQMVLDGKSTTFISNLLNDKGITGKRGRLWTSTTVLHILHNEAYKGVYTWLKSSSGNRKPRLKNEIMRVQGVYPAIIPTDDWEKVQAILTSRKQNRAPTRAKKNHLFSGLVSCAECGRALRYRNDKRRKNGLIYSTYYCAGHLLHWHCTNGAYVSDVTLAPFVLQFIENCIELFQKIKYIRSSDDIEKIICSGLGCRLINKKEIYNWYLGGVNESTPARAEAIRRKAEESISKIPELINKHQRALEKLKDAYLYGDGMTKEEYFSERVKILNELEKVKNAGDDSLKILSPNLHLDEELFKPILKFLENGNIDYPQMLLKIGHPLFCNFMHDAIKGMVLNERRVVQITTNNNVTYKFEY